ncbi:MAG: hypothetical protein WDA47_04205 [Bacilli bacterium]|jgi:hypothetical protein
MENKPKFVDGLRAFPKNEKAPEWVKLNLVVNESFVNWFETEKDEKGEVKMNLLKSKKGTLYFVKNEWKPKSENKPENDAL